MENAFSAVLATPQSTILTVAGILFLLLGVAGSVVGKINVPPERQKWAAIIGGGLLLAGILIPAPKPDAPLQGTVVSGATSTSDLEKDLESLRAMVEESMLKEQALDKKQEATDAATAAELEEQRKLTEKLKAAKLETERILKERAAVSELKHDIMQFYNNKGRWAGTFVMERIDKLQVRGNEAHVRYKYSPIQNNKQKRSDIGYDQRVFKLTKVGDKYNVASMGGNMSAKFN